MPSARLHHSRTQVSCARLTTHFPGSSRRRAAATSFFETRTVCRTLLAVRSSRCHTVCVAAARTWTPYSGATPPSAVTACRSTPLVLPVFLGTLLASVFANSIAFLGWCAVLSVCLCFCLCPFLCLFLPLFFSDVLCLVSVSLSCVCVCLCL